MQRSIQIGSMLSLALVILAGPGVSRADYFFSGNDGLSDLGSFKGTFAYQATNSTTATLTVTLTNTSSNGGFLTAFAFNNPGNLITNATLVPPSGNYNILGMPGVSNFNDVILTASLGRFDIGAGLKTTPLPNLLSNFLTSGVGAGSGIGVGQTAIFTFNLTGAKLDALSPLIFLTTPPTSDLLPPGPPDTASFVARFRGFSRGNDPNGLGDIVPVNYITEVPEPASLTLAGMAISGLVIFRLRRRRPEPA